ncbi:hypothetical protein FEE96_22960 [Parasedimentitalea maritima]|uniref:Tetratricopeptide repeat protein n=1 Tax=Parasedimentitalea maritima TaxID=2578117 RepID=A0ABY2UTV3_9RHOB|nr:hypothetical protein [Zongyanglinia marina]TLP55337.1 hypothetical protein FEE96_22960 [Zongyanglinia marina]
MNSTAISTSEFNTGDRLLEAELLVALASLQYIYGQTEKATNILELVCFISPGNPKALEMLAILKADQCEHSVALEMINKLKSREVNISKTLTLLQQNLLRARPQEPPH